MFNNIDLETLAEQSGPDRAFLSVYLKGPDSLDWLERRIDRVRELLEDDADELEHFERNVETLREFMEEHPLEEGGRCLFCCWATNFMKAYHIEADLPDLLWVDSSPYIRPLAELQDEYENFVVVTADNSEARVYYVTSARPKEEEHVRGDIKNHVRKGGWSQQRYQRRRENELLHYAKEVAEALEDLHKRKSFEYIVLLGQEEAMAAVEEELPEALKEMIAGRESIDLKDPNEIWDTAFEAFFEEERAWDRSLWEEIKGEYMRDGRAVMGPEHVLDAAAVGRVERMLVTRDAKLKGVRCRDCENLSEIDDDRGEGDESDGARSAPSAPACPVCGSESTFAVDLVNELVELLELSSAEVEFTDHIRGLTKAGHVAALLRY